jgi:PAS domain S-box-containing protein
MTFLTNLPVPSISGGGALGQHVRDTDWSQSRLGPYQAWSPSLRSSLSLVLNAQGIAALCWGSEQLWLHNDAFGGSLGEQHALALGRPLAEALPTIAPILGPQIAQVLNTGEGLIVENWTMVMHRHDPSKQAVWTCNLLPVQGETGEWAGVLLLATETTSQQKAEGVEKQAALQLEAALRLGRLGAFDWHTSTGAVAMDARAREIFALPQDTPIQATDLFARVAPEMSDRVQAESMAAAARGRVANLDDFSRRFDIHYDIVLPDGSRRSIESSGNVIPHPDGTHRMLGTLNDVTLIKLAQAQLRAQNVMLEQQVDAQAAEQERMWEASPDLMLVIDFDGVFRRVNPAWTRLLGYTADELVGHHVNEFVVPQDHTETIEAYTEAAEGGTPQIVNRYRHKDGSTRWIAWSAAPAGDLTYATGRDISAERERQFELELAQEALRQAQKLEAIGQLTGGVAHDFNNLLTVIKSATALLKRPELTDERRARYVTTISDTVDRAAKLTAQLLAFARRQALKPEVFAACDGVRALSAMMETLTGPQISVVTELPEQACFINADATQFDTALVNMAVNARDAMNGQGQLQIRVEPVTQIPAVRAHPVIHGTFVAVSISDTGGGIPAEQLEQIFEPFFTTKAVGQGTGLGLSQVYGFAKQSGGEVRVRSEVGRGSTFTFYLPRVAAPEQAQQQAQHQPLMDGHGTCVLVVEDNVDVGTFAVQTLRDLGYVPVLASNAEEALAELAKDADRFDVVFSDVVMPGMSGIELGHEIRRRHHDLPVLLASGYSHVLAQNGTYGFELLHKPYSVEELSRLLRKVATWQRRKRIMGR